MKLAGGQAGTNGRKKKEGRRKTKAKKKEKKEKRKSNLECGWVPRSSLKLQRVEQTAILDKKKKKDERYPKKKKRSVKIKNFFKAITLDAPDDIYIGACTLDYIELCVSFA